jgi:hypothetical protein
MADKAQYTIEIGDEKIVFEGPSGLTDRQIEQLGDKYLRTARPGQRFPHALYMGAIDTGEKPASDVNANDTSTLGSWLRGAEAGGYSN